MCVGVDPAVDMCDIFLMYKNAAPETPVASRQGFIRVAGRWPALPRAVTAAARVRPFSS